MNFQAKLKQIRELAGLDENVKSLLEKMTGKELVSYEGIDALVAALMTFYNGELKKKISVTEFNEKFKNFCPYLVGDIYITTNSNNPSTKYLGTTWQKIEGRFLLGTTGGGASKQTGGSMSKTIQQGHLPNVKLRVDSFGLTLNPPNIDLYNDYGGNAESGRATLATEGSAAKAGWTKSYIRINSAGSTGTASPNTSALGSGWSFDVTPSYYTTHIWLRTS